MPTNDHITFWTWVLNPPTAYLTILNLIKCSTIGAQPRPIGGVLVLTTMVIVTRRCARTSGHCLQEEGRVNTGAHNPFMTQGRVTLSG